MNGGEERTKEGDVGAVKEELKEDVGADARTCEEALVPSVLYFGPWPGPGNSDGGGFD
jgi:hypothetical protein